MDYQIPKALFSPKIIEDLNRCSAQELAKMLMIGYYNMQVSVTPNIAMSSAEKGQIGEDKVLQILKTKYTVEKVSDQARSGDIHIIHKPINVPEIRLLVEVKNYKRDVPKAEVEKFIRDINSDSRLHGALFVSLNTKLSGEDYSPLEVKDLDVNGRKIFTAYVVGDNTELICGAVALVLAQIQQHLRFVRSFEQLQASRYTKLYSSANKAFQTLQGFNQQRQLLIQSRDAAHKSLTSVIDGLSSLEGVLHQHLNKLLYKLHESQPEQLQQIKTIEIKIVELHEKISCLVETKAGYKFAECANHQTALRDLLNACCAFQGVDCVKMYNIGNMIEFKIGVDVVMRVKLWKTKTEISWPARLVDMNGYHGLFVPSECELEGNWIVWAANTSTSKNSYQEALKYWCCPADGK